MSNEGMTLEIYRAEAKKRRLSIPKIKNIHQTVLKAITKKRGRFDMSFWHGNEWATTPLEERHTCETTHCRAGWVVALAGREGVKLEKQFGTSLAARLIYAESDPSLEHVDMDRWFRVTNPTAMKHMKMLAEAEANEQQEALPPQCPRRK